MVFTDNDSANASEIYKAQMHVHKYLLSFQSCMAVKFATELGIADAIHRHGKPITLSGLASALNLPPSKVGVLHRFMRLLTHNGFFTKTPSQNSEEEEETYSLTLASKFLVRSNSFCLAPNAEVAFHPSMFNMWNSSKKLFTEDTQVPLFESVTGESYFDFIKNDFQFLNVFQKAVAADSEMVKLGLQQCKHVFEGLDSLVDVGGGTGAVSRLILESFPHMKCTVLDLPQVVANLKTTQNLSFVGGDMFESIPSADAVLLKWVLHNWDDELSIKILKNCKEAISGKGKEGKVIIIDVVIDEAGDDRDLTELKLNFDLAMLTLLNGKEREKKEWEKLIYQAGFTSCKFTPVFGFKSLIEVYP
ncbi:isoflavone 4'-O-methyltransferase-like [Vigna umbellata]|uniref:isoflavone 4'-O-methyltransferase-like n=1 Tax=Vigna umbellata TaxID=87088 RepID=UPI001F5F002C|nr:isoflavone 4'-O-methyltransferase-like [Vigna umbellata]